MKKYYSIAFSLFSALFFAQQTVSFEYNEGFFIGNINGQGGWISTPTGDYPENVENQSISLEKASDGNTSLKIVKEPTYGTQSEPIIGGFYNPQTPLSFTNFSVSFDINMSQLNGSDFGFQAVNAISEQSVTRIDFEKNGLVKILTSVSGVQHLVSTSKTWSPGIWYRVKIVGIASDIKYYLNDSLFYTGSAVHPSNISQLRFVHNNALGTAYIDHIIIDSGLTMAVKDSKADPRIPAIHPNPATDFIKIHTVNTIKEVNIYNAAGEKMKIELKGNDIDVSHLIPGTYFVNMKSGEKSFTEKLIKK